MISKIRWSKSMAVFMVSIAVVVALGVAMAFAAAPAPPVVTATGVTTATAGGAVKVGWSTVTGATSYVVQSKVATADASTYTTATTVTEPTCTVSGLTNGVGYSFRVASLNSEGTSWSVSADATPTDTHAPTTSLVTSPTAGNGANGWFTSWPTYHLSANETVTSSFQTATAGSQPATSTFVALSGIVSHGGAGYLLTEGTNHLWFYSVDSANNTESVGASATVKIDVSAPSVPGMSTATTGGAITATWPVSVDTVSGVSTYTVQYSLESSFTSPVIAGTATTNTLTFGSFSEGQHVYLRVKAADVASNESTWSATSSAITIGDATAPVLTVIPANSSTWTTPSITATVSIVETSTGLAYVNYKLFKTGDSTPSSGATLTAIDTTRVVVPIPEGDYTLKVNAKDLAGNAATEVTRRYLTDSHAPVTVIDHTTPASPDGSGSVFVTPPTVNLRATDAASGATITIQYRWGNDATTSVAGTSSVVVPAPSGAGTQTLTYGAFDGAGNTEVPYHTQSYFISVVARTLTYTADAHGSIVGSRTQTVNNGASGSAVTAVANTGYHFVNWSDLSTANPRTDTNVTADKSVIANFAINTYTLTPSRSNKHGTITPSKKQTVNYGGSKTFKMKPARNYKISKVLVNGKNIGKKTSYKFKNVKKNYTIKVYFKHK